MSCSAGDEVYILRLNLAKLQVCSHHTIVHPGSVSHHLSIACMRSFYGRQAARHMRVHRLKRAELLLGTSSARLPRALRGASPPTHLLLPTLSTPFESTPPCAAR